MRALICGSRHWSKPVPIDVVVAGLAARFPGLVIIEGEARGADSIARDAAFSRMVPVEGFPADWSQGRKAGPLRNQQMLDEGRPQVVFAFSDDLIQPTEGVRGGTADMVRRAVAAEVPTYVIGKAH